jgi:rfaE bifunctional protein kinase chain/domain
MKDLSEKITDAFPDKKIVIVGDLVADQFLRGTINRVSREAPVFILRHDVTETLAGGAGNAAVNVAALGGKAVLVGILGKDLNGTNLKQVLDESGVECKYLVTPESFQTTTKVRVLAGQNYAPRQQVIRIDYENTEEIGPEIIERLKQNIVSATEDADAIIISDYNCGVAGPAVAGLCQRISGEKNIPLLIDSRFRLAEFGGATTATPNQEEVEQILGRDFTEEDCLKLRKDLNLEALLITRGNQGMLLLEKDEGPVVIEAVGSKEPVDVTGAGDTVIAAYALGLASGLGFPASARLANYAGGIVVMKKGTASVSSEELISSIKKEIN